MQISDSGKANTTMPKLLAVAIPTALGAGGAAWSFYDKNSKTAFIFSAAEIVFFAIMLFVNL